MIASRSIILTKKGKNEMGDLRVNLEKAISEAKDGRIRYLEDQILAYKEQQQIDLAVKKDLDEKLDKVTADYRALWVENDRLKDQLAHEKAERDNLADTVTKMEKKVRDLDERNNNLRDRLASTNASLKISVRKEAELRSVIDQARDDDPHSDIGIVIAVAEDNPCFTIVGPKFQAFFDETDIESGRVKKTGKYFDSVPLDYLA